MKRAIYTGKKRELSDPVAQLLTQRGASIETAETAEETLSLISTAGPPADLVVIFPQPKGASARQLVETVTMTSPFSLCVVAGNMADNTFHDHYEGYGVLMQISDPPTERDAEQLGQHLDKLAGLGGTTQ